MSKILGHMKKIVLYLLKYMTLRIYMINLYFAEFQ